MRAPPAHALRRWFDRRAPESQRETLAARYLALVLPAVLACVVASIAVGTAMDGAPIRRILGALVLVPTLAAGLVARRWSARTGLLVLVAGLASLAGFATVFNGVFAFGFIGHFVVLSIVVPVYGVRGGGAYCGWIALTAAGAFGASALGFANEIGRPHPLSMAIVVIFMALMMLTFASLAGSLSSEALERSVRHRRQMESARALATEFHAVFEEAETLLCMVDAQGVLRRVNRKIREAMGAAEAEAAIGQAFVDAPFWAAERARVARFIADALAGETPQLEFVQTGPDGDRVLRVSATPHRPTPGLPVARVLVETRDVTEIAAAHSALARAQRLESIGTLAGGIAHDFNNMLASIQLSIEVLREAGDADIDVLDGILDAADRAHRLTAKLLAFGRADVFDTRRIDPEGVLATLATLLRRTCGSEIELVLDLGCTEPVAIEADQTALEQLLVNLVLNARDAMPDGGRITLQSRIESIGDADAPDDRPAKHYVWRVSDTGHGIEPAHLDRIFEPFFTTKGVEQGTGLGLAAVHGTVKAHDGTIDVTSSPSGTCFEIRLPVADPLPTSNAPVATPSVRPASGSELAPRVLVVDDDPSMRTLVAAALARAGYEVTTAADGREAVERLAETSYALVVTDVVMPHLDGVGVATHVASMADAPALVLMSAFPRGDLGERLAGVNFEFVRKPFQPSELLAHVANLVPIEPRAAPCPTTPMS